jgi:HD superfamily phosphodiesterase
MNNFFDIEYYNNIFEEYTKPFLNQKENTIKENIKIKILHSKNVQNNCRAISSSENLSISETFVAELCGLLHDIGRFEQYVNYATFRDDQSVYHGQLGVEIIKKHKILENLPAYMRNIIIEAVYNHGLFKITETTIREELYFSKLVRDADKIDIYRIVSEYYNKKGTRNIALEYGLIHEPKISDNIINDFCNHKLISKLDLRTLNDFKTMQLSWIFDFNFEYTKKIILEAGYLDLVLDSISDNRNKSLLNNTINEFLKSTN